MIIRTDRTEHNVLAACQYYRWLLEEYMYLTLAMLVRPMTSVPSDAHDRIAHCGAV